MDVNLIKLKVNSYADIPTLSNIRNALGFMLYHVISKRTLCKYHLTINQWTSTTDDCCRINIYAT